MIFVRYNSSQQFPLATFGAESLTAQGTNIYSILINKERCNTDNINGFLKESKQRENDIFPLILAIIGDIFSWKNF